MKAYVGVTDSSWYEFLAARPELDEINFWRPSAKTAFRVLRPGEPFYFKSHHPHNQLIGGAVYAGFARLRVSEAWEIYAEGNGQPSLDAMRERIGGYRGDPIAEDDPVIGCVLLHSPRFLPQGTHFGPPPEFAPSIVQGKGYDLEPGPHTEFFLRFADVLFGAGGNVNVEADTRTWHRPGRMFGEPAPRPRRLGQSAFKGVVLDAYDGRCAVTGSRVRPTLQAAHIRPVTSEGEHRLDNGILFRSDVHTLFDRGYLGIDADYRVVVSGRLSTEFGESAEFEELNGKPIGLPERRVDRPGHDFLDWHRAHVFRP
ncbi:HNH endonuclease [Murinocardiopsis flavida]|nr:HNH endonuclease [Murinocardiopsis flavida]